MLEITDATLSFRDGSKRNTILRNLALRYPRPHLGAIIGPSGCGKSTLLKIIAGLHTPEEGAVLWNGRDLDRDEDIAPADLGYVPQFSIFHESLTVRESLDDALKLRVRGLRRADREARLQEVLGQVGLEQLPDRRGSQLSGGQRRRLGLALEILTRPSLLLCDEVTSGLDPNSEEEIVHLLRDLADQDRGRLVLSVTHTLGQLDLYDSVTVLQAGYVVYSGPAHHLMHYFGVEAPEGIYGQLASRPAEDWAAHWAEYQQEYALPGLPEVAQAPAAEGEPPEVSGHDAEEETTENVGDDASPAGEDASSNHDEPPLSSAGVPGGMSQFFTLLSRRWRIFFRESGQVGLQLTLLFLFPVLVVPFAIEGLPQVRELSQGLDVNPLIQAREKIEFLAQTSRIGGLVSGLIMFQVVLMTLMGSNNGAREVVAERAIFEKEKLAGLAPSAFLFSKVFYLVVLVVAQSAWMTVFVKLICQFPGDLLPQMAMLFLANAALTFLTLGVSSWARTPEQSSLVSIYFVGFQLPLSGAFLAMPEVLGAFTRPFIAAYWSWSGFLQTLVHTRYYDLAEAITKTPLSSLSVCYWVLVWHIIAGILIAYFGCARSRWE